jgi:hypothetical protein
MDQLALMGAAYFAGVGSTVYAVIKLRGYLESLGLKLPTIDNTVKTVTPTEERPTIRDMERPTVVDMESPHTRYMG